MSSDKIMDKIKKLLALATSDQPGEAASAMAMAQKLMAEHKLSESDLEMSEIMHDEVKSTASVSTHKIWEGHLIKLMERAFGVKCIIHPNHSSMKDPFMRFAIIGSRSQVMIAKHTMVVLQRNLYKARVAFLKDIPVDLARMDKIELAESFANGWVTTVSDMVIDYGGIKQDKAIEAYVKNNWQTEGARAKPSVFNAIGHLAGVAAGQDERLYRPMDEHGNEVKQLGVTR